MMTSVYRRSLLGLAETPAIKRFIKGQGWKLGVGRFVAGETLTEALPKLRSLHERGLAVNLDLLGEYVDTAAGATAMKNQIISTLNAISAEPFEGYMSLKPTQLGLGLSFDMALDQARDIARAARTCAAHICFDMENYPFVEPTLRLFESLRHEGFDNVSTVLQSYLHRTPEDMERLLPLSPTLRIVKGAYLEDEAVAFKDKKQVDRAFRDLVYRGLEGGAKINIASHDESIVLESEAFLQGADLDRHRYEFQFLYGVKPSLQTSLAARGHPVRIYVPYGEDWYGYFSRRLAERPANLMFVARGLFG